jgi:hypothetical protein
MTITIECAQIYFLLTCARNAIEFVVVVVELFLFLQQLVSGTMFTRKTHTVRQGFKGKVVRVALYYVQQQTRQKMTFFFPNPSKFLK